MERRSSPSALTGLALLSAINLFNFADRYVVGGVQELIKRDPAFPGGARDAFGQLTDASLGTLTTLFVIVFVIASPITGWLGDRIPRKFLVAGGVVVWSLATVGSGLARSFGEFMVARAFIGAGEAGYATVAPSILSDLFPPHHRNRALGVMQVMVPLGAALGFGLGATLAQIYSWRTAFLISGAPGLVLALAYLLTPEPQRGTHDAPGETLQPLAPWPTLVALGRNRDFVINTAGQVLLTFTVGGLANWMPSFLVRQLGMEQGEAGRAFGILTASAGILGTVAGTLGGEWAHKRHPRGYLWISGVSLVAAAPAVLVVAAAPGYLGTMAATFAALFLVLFNLAPLYAALVNSVPAHLRSSAVALLLLATHILGDAISPPLIGAVSDATGSLSIAVAANSIPLLLGGLVLLAGAKRTVAELASPRVS